MMSRHVKADVQHAVRAARTEREVGLSPNNDNGGRRGLWSITLDAILGVTTADGERRFCFRDSYSRD